MALPTQEIERLTRSVSAEQGTYKQLLLLSGALFAISAILWAGLSFGYEPYLRGQVDTLDSQIQQFAKDIPVAEQAKLTTFYSQLVNLKTLLGRHAATSKIFNWLENNSQVNTYFTKLSFNASTYQLTLLGTSKAPEDVSEQASILESQPEVLRLNFNNISAAPNGGWQFNIAIFLDPRAFLPAGSTAQVVPLPPSNPPIPSTSQSTSTSPITTSTVGSQPKSTSTTP